MNHTLLTLKMVLTGIGVNNMKKRNLLVLATATLLLTGCNDIYAKPTDLEEKTLIESASALVNNSLESVYNNYRDSSTFKETALDEVILAVAENEFGAYSTLEATDPFKIAVDRRAKHLFYEEIKSGSYTFRIDQGADKGVSVFDEEKFIREHIYGNQNSYIVDASGEEVEIGALNTLPTGFFKEGLFLPVVDKDNFDDPTHKLIHIDYYSHYIEDQFVDTIYREKLVEKYVQSEQKTTLGRNYAREVEYIAIQNNDNHPTAASTLVNKFVDKYILGASKDKFDLNILANAWRGVDDDLGAEEIALLTETNLKVPGRDHTLYGDVLSDYAKIDNNPELSDETIENRFTGSNTYPKEIGLAIEKDSVRKQDFITSEWGIKNGGISGLPESIRTRLFNIGVANAVDLIKDDGGSLAKAGEWTNKPEGTLPSTFVRNINGNHFLVTKENEPGNNRNFVFYEDSTYYIVVVKEAVNTAKLTEGDVNYYDKLGKTAAEIEAIKEEVAYHLAQIAATKTNALNFYMEELKVVFHDEDVLEFFKTEFPEIFDED